MANSLESSFRLDSGNEIFLDRIIFFVIAQILHLRLGKIPSDQFSHRRLDPVEQRFLPSLEESSAASGTRVPRLREPPRCSSGPCPEPPSRTVQAGGRCPAGPCLPGSSEKPGLSPPASRFRRETMGTEIQTIRSQRRLHRTPRIRPVLRCTVFSWATARERALRLTGIRPARLEPSALIPSGHERMVNGRAAESGEEKSDLIEAIARFGDILDMEGPLVESGARSVFPNSDVGGWQ